MDLAERPYFACGALFNPKPLDPFSLVAGRDFVVQLARSSHAEFHRLSLSQPRNCRMVYVVVPSRRGRSRSVLSTSLTPIDEIEGHAELIADQVCVLQAELVV